jgi:uncharacterized protein
VTVSTHQPNLPDYEQLVKFLFQPFLNEADVMAIDCEYTIDRQRIWIRVAVASADRDSAFGRGGRNIQAVRTVVQAAAAAVGQSINLDIYGSSSSSRQMDSDRPHDDLEAGSSADPSASRPVRSAPNRRSADASDAPAEQLPPRSSVPPPRPRRQV